MACKDHLTLSQFIKEVHSSLRKSSQLYGANYAWEQHCKDNDKLSKYAVYMEKLATTHWETTCSNDVRVISRIQWSFNFCTDYFMNKSYLCHRNKEKDISAKINISLDSEESFSFPLKLIDVGSCFNPFKIYDIFDVCAVDLYPANQSVHKCDFLKVILNDSLLVSGSSVVQLPITYYDIVTFCFLLEYIPNSNQRILACEKAYKILKPGGLLLISTPDSKHVGANSKTMKNWRYTLACIGFSRIKYEKFKHMHCMAFRKSLQKETSVRWAILHKEPYMDFTIQIPQDLQSKENKNDKKANNQVVTSVEDFCELPLLM